MSPNARGFAGILRQMLVLMGLLCLAGVPQLQGQGAEGFYKLESLSGNGTRTWKLNALLDGIPADDFGSVTIRDTMLGPGEFILKDDGTVEAKWKHRVTITYDYQPDYYRSPWPVEDDEEVRNSWEDEWFYHYLSGEVFDRPVNELSIEFDTEATGTWTEGLSFTLDCSSECTATVKYKPEDSMQLETENLDVSLDNVSVSFTASGAPDNLKFKINMLDTFVQKFADQHLTGDRYLAVEDALREGSVRKDPGPGEFAVRTVQAWSYEGTDFSCGPTDGELEAKYEQFYLLDVSAPYGFYVQGDWGTAEGLQEVEFRYEGETYRTSVESGYAEAASFDYEKAATLIEADILSDGSVALTLSKDLIKVPVSPWAGSAGDFSSQAGVLYKRGPLDWPISMTATRVLSNASILTGLWGINGSASSKFEVSAHSEGTPQDGNLTANIDFKVAKKELSMSLTGSHQTTLNAAGLTASGDFTTSPLSASWRQEASLLSLVPGAGAAMAALGPIGTRLSNGAGVSVEARVDGTLSGTYLATPGDSSPEFTSGTLTVDASLTAQVDAVPKFARGVVNLSISGGGGAIMVIDLAPDPAVSSLTGYLNFGLQAKFFGLEEEVDKEWFFGDPPPDTMGLSAKLGAPPASDSDDPLEANEFPAGHDAEISFDTSGNPELIIYSEQHPTLPAPASQIVVRYPDIFVPDSWLTRTTATEGGLANFAPTFGQRLTVPVNGGGQAFFRGVAVWAQATGTAPEDTADLPGYMDSTELRYRYYNASGFSGGFEGGERSLTDNAAADFGPSIAPGQSDESVRLFWVRGSGMDLTGATTPLQILTRNWVVYDESSPADDPSIAWSPEVTAVSGLAHIVDWRAVAWDSANSALALVVDADGDLSTLEDTELWLARETAGVWAAPTRVTTNSVLDEAPVMLFKDASTLVLGWRQGLEVVGTADYDTDPVPATWFTAESEVAEVWGNAQLLHRSGEDSLVALWPQDQGLAYTEQAYGPVVAGTAWPAPRYHAFTGGVVSTFMAGFDVDNDPGQERCNIVAIAQNSTPGSLSTVPAPLPSTVHSTVLTFGPEARRITVRSATASIPNPQVGDDLRLSVEVESPLPVTYSWTRDGTLLGHFTGPELHLMDLGPEDVGTYMVTISDGTNTRQHQFQVNLATTYLSWINGHVPGGGPNLAATDDYDKDGGENALEYLFDTDPTDPADRATGSFAPSPYYLNGEAVFVLNQAADDVQFVIEYTDDFETWHDFTSYFDSFPVADGKEIYHSLTPYSEEAVAFWDFPEEITGQGSYRVRITSGP